MVGTDAARLRAREDEMDEARLSVLEKTGSTDVQELVAEVRSLRTSERALVDAVTAAMVETGPQCFVCAEDIEQDDSPCDPDGCSGYPLRKLVTETRKVMASQSR